jgi:hypothetical protein
VSSRTRSPRRADPAGRTIRETIIAHQLHDWLAIASVVAVVLVGLEATVRTVRRRPPGVLTERIEQICLIAILVTGAGGLGLLVGGGRPREILHFVYAIVALGALPVADSISRRMSPRRQGVTSLVGAAVALVVVARLFATG